MYSRTVLRFFHWPTLAVTSFPCYFFPAQTVTFFFILITFFPVIFFRVPYRYTLTRSIQPYRRKIFFHKESEQTQTRVPCPGNACSCITHGDKTLLFRKVTYTCTCLIVLRQGTKCNYTHARSAQVQ